MTRHARHLDRERRKRPRPMSWQDGLRLAILIAPGNDQPFTLVYRDGKWVRA